MLSMLSMWTEPLYLSRIYVEHKTSLLFVGKISMQSTYKQSQIPKWGMVYKYEFLKSLDQTNMYMKTNNNYKSKKI